MQELRLLSRFRYPFSHPWVVFYFADCITCCSLRAQIATRLLSFLSWRSTRVESSKRSQHRFTQEVRGYPLSSRAAQADRKRGSIICKLPSRLIPRSSSVPFSRFPLSFFLSPSLDTSIDHVVSWVPSLSSRNTRRHSSKDPSILWTLESHDRRSSDQDRTPR